MSLFCLTGFWINLNSWEPSLTSLTAHVAVTQILLASCLAKPRMTDEWFLGYATENHVAREFSCFAGDFFFGEVASHAQEKGGEDICSHQKM